MSCVSLDVLPFDICDRVLTSLPDYFSLRSALLSSKHLYDAYSPRKRSIMRAVGTNEAGPALSFATALVRAMRMLGKQPLQVILEGLNNLDSDSTFWTTDVTGDEAYGVSRVSAVVWRLESIFCVLHKDRAAPISTLSEAESFKFHRAIYRTWLLSVLANDAHKLSKHHGLDNSFLKNMSEEELVELHEAMLFLDELYVALMLIHSRFQGFFHHSSRPFGLGLDELLAQFDGSISALTYGIALHQSGTAIVNGYTLLLKERQIEKLLHEKYDDTSILTSPRVDYVQACQKCNVQTQLLFGENNWHFLHTVLNLDALLSCLPGKLNGNAYVKIDMSAILERRTSFTSMLGEMFDSQNDPESVWAKSDWLCMDCIRNFLQERLFSWLISELVKDGHQFKQNCWYGWNCRTQTHRLEHAKKLNHLCGPTDRDDTDKNIVPPVVSDEVEDEMEDEE